MLRQYTLFFTTEYENKERERAFFFNTHGYIYKHLIRERERDEREQALETFNL